MLESTARSNDGTRIAARRCGVEVRSAADPALEMFGARKPIAEPAAQRLSISFASENAD